jgi:carbazole 1,9a-dioxygenase terminal dioxygenase component
VGIPSDPDSKLVGKLKLRSYPIEERKGMLFVFIGDIEPPPLEDDLPPEFLADDMHVVPFHQQEVASNWRVAADSASELNHTFIHRRDALLDYWRQPLPFAEIPRGNNPYEGWILHEGAGFKGLPTRSATPSPSSSSSSNATERSGSSARPSTPAPRAAASRSARCRPR